MKDYRSIKIEDYTYDLPEERIAKYPKKNRDESKLLHFSDGEISTSIFKDLPDLLKTDDLLVFNNAKVIQARLAFQKETGANIEIFCLEPHEPADYNLAFQATGQSEWKCLVGNLKKWKSDYLYKNIEINGLNYQIGAKKVGASGNAVIVKFEWYDVDSECLCSSLTFGDILENIGSTPLPPYLNRKAEKEDKNRYQTVYAKQKGSVAAPTAGLHFTDNVFEKLGKKGIKTKEVTLHVSAGTFRPVQSETIEGHEMHEEHFEIKMYVLEQLINHSGRVISVGTTSVRTLESLYWMGVKLINNESEPFAISQWEAYEMAKDIDLKTSLGTIKSYMVKNELTVLLASTRIIIVPGYDFKVIKGLVTNFHQPQSTLLLLIAGVIGNKWKDVYDYALANDYRFLSYGDSSLFFIDEK
jgi:S-adenosylmethionine:tRNA ribosyltransferase-isomerase